MRSISDGLNFGCFGRGAYDGGHSRAGLPDRVVTPITRGRDSRHIPKGRICGTSAIGAVGRLTQLTEENGALFAEHQCGEADGDDFLGSRTAGVIFLHYQKLLRLGDAGGHHHAAAAL